MFLYDGYVTAAVCRRVQTCQNFVIYVICGRNAHIHGAIQKFPKYINKNYYVLPGSYSASSPLK
jgi:hypothetical protein